MNIYTEPGSTVIFTGKGGSDYDQKDAAHWLKVGEAYTVNHVRVGACRSQVYLEGVPGSFNTTMFANTYEREKKIVRKVIEYLYCNEDDYMQVEPTFNHVWESIEQDLKNEV